MLTDKTGEYKKKKKTARIVSAYFAMARSLSRTAFEDVALTISKIEARLKILSEEDGALDLKPRPKKLEPSISEEDFVFFWTKLLKFHEVERWNGHKYLLAEYLRSKGRKIKKKLEITSNLTLEHIVPRSAEAANALWGMSNQVHSNNLGKLGNLTLLKDAKNKELSDKGKEAKSQGYRETGLVEHKEISDVLSLGKWDKDTIHRRAESIINWAKVRWISAFPDVSEPTMPKKVKK